MNKNNNLQSETIFDENSYDEMQKTQNHEIGFKLFRVMFFVSLFFSMILVMLCSNANELTATIISIVFFTVNFGFYIAYAYMTAKKGIMNPKFAKNWSAKWIIPVYVVLEIWIVIRMLRSERELSDIALMIQWQIIVLGAIAMSLCAMKNNRVVRFQLAEDEADE